MNANDFQYIEDRLVLLLVERGYNVSIHPRSRPAAQDWEIKFIDNHGTHHLIEPHTQVQNLWWLVEPDGKAAKTPFESWLKELDGFFMEAYGLSHTDFEDWDWYAEFDSDNSPLDAFREWQAINQP